MHRLKLAGILVLVVALPACGVQRSRLHGTITYLGKPLSGAVITFFGQDNMTYSADTGPDGAYEVAGVPRGAIRVAVQLPPPRPRPRANPDLRKAGDAFAKEQSKADDTAKMSRLTAPPPSPMPPAGNLPPHYANPSSSGLSFDLKDPDHEYSIDLKG